MSERLKLVEREPTVAEYQKFRKAVGWQELSDDSVKKGLSHALFSICLLRDDKAIGCARVVGDGSIYFYIQDVIVLPQYQGRGFGKILMAAVMKFLDDNAQHNSFIGLMAAKGVKEFYEKYGFAERPAGRPGMYLMWKKEE